MAFDVLSTGKPVLTQCHHCLGPHKDNDVESEDEEGCLRGYPATTGYGWGGYPMRQVWQLQSPDARWLGSRLSGGIHTGF